MKTTKQLLQSTKAKPLPEMHSTKFHVTFTECQTVDLNIERCNHHAREEECLARIQFILDLTIYHLCDNLGSWFINCEIWIMIKKGKGKKLESWKIICRMTLTWKEKRAYLLAKCRVINYPSIFVLQNLRTSRLTQIPIFAKITNSILSLDYEIWGFGDLAAKAYLPKVFEK